LYKSTALDGPPYKTAAARVDESAYVKLEKRFNSSQNKKTPATKRNITIIQSYKTPVLNSLLALQPPAKMAMFPTDAAASQPRAKLSRAVDHIPVVMLYKSTASEFALFSALVKPPAKTATFPTDAAASHQRATLS
jgi:hypothetical protein